MAIKNSKDLLEFIRGSSNIQLNKYYRKIYLDGLKEDLKLAKAKLKAGILMGVHRKSIAHLERAIKDIDKNYPYLKKIKVEVIDGN